jgi:GNAT superfamily N-acetyltransferase
MLELSYAKNDSLRFGLNIHRTPGSVDGVDATALLDYILENNVDTAIIRIPSVKLATLNALDRTGMPYVVADTLAYYDYDLASHPDKPLTNSDLTFHLAGPEDHELLDQLVRTTFGSYVNHYRINPYLENEQVTEGYQEWMRSYAEGNPNRICWIMRKAGEVVGFSTFNFQIEERVEGILYGVLPEFRRFGIFRDTIRYAQRYAKHERGCTLMRVTSQIENIYPQRVWTREGFELNHTVNTVHINAMLTKSIFEAFTVTQVMSDEEKVSPKVSNRHLLKRINWEFDYKQNIVTRNHRFVNLAALTFGEEYTFKYSYPAGSKGLLRVIDSHGKTVVLVYFELKHVIA